MENILEIKGLSKHYNDFDLNNINFTLKRGYIMGFIGANGAGKTTTIKLIMNLIKKNSGEIYIFDKDNVEYEKEIKNKIGFVYDECNFFETLSINDNAKMISPFYSEWNQSTFNNYLAKFGLNKKQKLKELSKGMKIKFQLAIALSHDAELLIMDEPTSGLDPIFRSEILDLLRDYIEDGNKSVLFSTHITADLEKSADYITFINNGNMVFSMEKDEVMDKYKIIKGGLDLLDNNTKELLIGIKKNSYGFKALTTKSAKLYNKFADNIVIDTPTLDDIMIHIVGDKKWYH